MKGFNFEIQTYQKRRRRKKTTYHVGVIFNIYLLNIFSFKSTGIHQFVGRVASTRIPETPAPVARS
jgi:hypothetical protein